MSQMKSQIVEIFLRVREEQRAPYEEKDFLRFLTRPKLGTTGDSFKRERYRNRFFEQIEMEFQVCFPNSVVEKKWNLGDFIAYVQKRSQEPEVNRRLALNRLREGWTDCILPFFFLNLFLLGPAPWLSMRFSYGWLYLIVPVAANLLLGTWVWADISHQKRLIARIGARGDSVRNNGADDSDRLK